LSTLTLRFPLFYKNVWGSWRGIYVDMWTAIANRLGQPLLIHDTNLVAGGYTPDSSGIFDGVLDLLQNGTITAAVSNYVPNVERCSTFRCSTGYNSGPVLEWYIQGVSDNSLFAQLSTFVPFPPLITTLFIVSYGIITFLCAVYGNRRRLSFGVHAVTSLLCLFLFTILYGTAFTGNALLPPSTRSVLCGEVQIELSRVIDLLFSTIPGNSHSSPFFSITRSGPNYPPRIKNSTISSLIKMCSSDEYIFHDMYFTMSQSHSRRALTLPCPLQRVDSSGSLPSFVPRSSMLFAIGERGAARVNLYHRNNTRLDQAASFIILSLYDADKFEGLMHRRYTGMDQIVKEEEREEHVYNPLPLRNIYALFVVLMFLYSISFAV
ncbi:hypothetical protein PMAYCL1PPCAC_19784, partial [Pristionchus mayeri]